MVTTTSKIGEKIPDGVGNILIILTARLSEGGLLESREALSE